MAGQPKTRAKREERVREERGFVDPIELIDKLTEGDLEKLAYVYLMRKGIDPRSLTPSRASKSIELPKFKLPWMGPFLLALRDTGNVRSACQTASVARQTVYQHREMDDLFREWWDVCLADAIDLLEMSAWALASRLDGSMIRFLLMAHRPDLYAQNVNMTHRGDKDRPIEHNVTSSVAVYLPDNKRGDQSAPTVPLLSPPSGEATVVLDGTYEIELETTDAEQEAWRPSDDEDDD